MTTVLIILSVFLSVYVMLTSVLFAVLFGALKNQSLSREEKEILRLTPVRVMLLWPTAFIQAGWRKLKQGRNHRDQ